MENSFEIVPITVVYKGRLDFIYIITLNWYCQFGRDKKIILKAEDLHRKSTVAGQVGMKTISLTSYLKNNCNYDLTLEPRSRYTFHTLEDAKKAKDYLNDCLVAKKLTGV